MAYDLNEVNLIGRITSSIEIKETPNGAKVVNFSIATNETFTDKQGEVKDVATFHNIVIWGKLAEIVEKYATKGSKVFLKGKLQTRSWKDPETEATRYKTEILGSQVILLDSKKSSQDEMEFEEDKAPVKKATKAPPPKRRNIEEEVHIEDIPF